MMFAQNACFFASGCQISWTLISGYYLSTIYCSLQYCVTKTDQNRLTLAKGPISNRDLCHQEIIDGNLALVFHNKSVTAPVCPRISHWVLTKWWFVVGTAKAQSFQIESKPSQTHNCSICHCIGRTRPRQSSQCAEQNNWWPMRYPIALIHLQE